MSATQTAEQIADLNLKTAEALSQPETPLDNYAAELILRNVVVMTDRLTAGQFSGLAPNTVDSVLDAAAAAKKLAPLPGADLEKLPHESDTEYEYRISVRQPLQELQNRIAKGEFTSYREAEADELKAALKLGSKAFAAAITNADDYPAVQRDLNYFQGNTEAAAGRLVKLHYK